MSGVALVALTQDGAALARRLQGHVPGARVHGLDPRVIGADVEFAETAAHLRKLFEAGTTIVGICAAGILIRTLAPLLDDKRQEPAVLAIAEDASAVVPLLGGHRGANQLARMLAAALGIAPAITTAGDVALGFALDSPPPGWQIANPAAVKTIAAALLAGDSVRLTVEAGDAGWLARSGRFAESGELAVVVTDLDIAGDAATLVFHPPVLAVGIGGERHVGTAEIETLVRETLREHGLSPRAVACLVTLDLKEDEPAMHELAAELGVPLRVFTPAELAAQAPRLKNPSAIVEKVVGVPGVAEGAALAAVGPDGTLIVPKVKSARATCAIARAARDLSPHAIGRARGRLSVVGIGPGDAALRTPDADAALAAASDVVGYRLYLDLLGSALTGKRVHDSALGAEEERARLALDLASQGCNVALVSSGDAGVYGLAALAFELIERGERAEWRRLDVEVCPGISALLAAAARAGAPLGHDFCAVSLSDLLTPWPDIERRLHAAAAGDFVVALYNPASQRRREAIVRARDILAAHRPADTPVILARSVGRSDEAIDLETLGGAWTERVDMLTLVIVGSTATRLVDVAGRVRVYTPRGYAAKRQP